MDTSTLALAFDLISRPSITPEDNGCQSVMISRLSELGFQIETLSCNGVDNFWARLGNQEPLFVFAGHTDVVPPGPLDSWKFPPFEPTINDGYLYGRGTADMKCSLAAMITSCERFLTVCKKPHGSIAFLITSDEEGEAVHGTVKVIEMLETRGEKIRWCLVGEPSCTDNLGDTIKNGRRGSLNGKLILYGIQGHIAYPHLARNPIHVIGIIINALIDTIWDEGDNFFQPTAFQISNIQSGTGIKNIIPNDVEMLFNFRFSPVVTAAQLKEQTRLIIDNSLNNEKVKTGQVCLYSLEWELSGQPFFTPPGDLLSATVAAIRAETGLEPILSTGGGTSDGRFIAPTGAEVIEFGPLNATIHKINECIPIDDLELLSRIYERVIGQLLS
jgi:succinyl-diaminopimelate desuccinylase